MKERYFVKYDGPGWIEGCLIIQKAWNGLPPGFKNIPIYNWEELVNSSKKMIEAEIKNRASIL